MEPAAGIAHPATSFMKVLFEELETIALGAISVNWAWNMPPELGIGFIWDFRCQSLENVFPIVEGSVLNDPCF